jgi:2-dehydropantoate 2-reductase
MKIVVIGGGAMGLIHAALLSRVVDTSLLVRRAEQAQTLLSNGVTIVSEDGDRTNHRLAASSTPEDLDSADLVIIAVKSYQTEDVAELLAASSNNRSTILSIQNGIRHNDILAKVCGENRVLLGKTGYAGSRIDETTVQVTGSGSTVFGERSGEMSDRVLALEPLFRKAGINVETSDQMWSVLWSKFAQACSQNALSAVTRKPFDDLLASESARQMLHLLSIEMTELARAENVELQFDPYERLLENWVGLNHRSSMLQDLEAGRPTEVDALNGDAVRRGEQLGIPMPTNRSIWLLMKATTDVREEQVLSTQ